MKIKVYVLRSIKDGARYVGISQNLERRLQDHNSGKNRYTKGHMPWEIKYNEEYETWEEARSREKYFKSGAGRIYLEKKLKNEYKC